MDGFLFDEQLRKCKFQPEEIHYLEILHFAASPPCIEQHRLPDDEIENFVECRGVFNNGPDVTNGIRLLFQADLRNPDALSPDTVSLTGGRYEYILHKMRLPLEVVETTNVLGPFLWWGYVDDPNDSNNSHFQLIFRKTDVTWRGVTRGWDMVLSYSFRTGITSGYIRGTISAGVNRVMDLLTKCAESACHPLLLPLLMLSRYLSENNESSQREVRDRLRKLESATVRRGIEHDDDDDGYPTEAIRLDATNRELGDLQARAMWKSPQAWRKVVQKLSAAASYFWDKLSQDSRTPELQALHDTILRRLEFTTARLTDTESYTQTSLDRLSLQREVMNSFVSLRDSRLSFGIAVQQQRLAQATRQDSISMKTLTLLGAMFLPGAFLSSMFGMSFFDFSSDISSSVSPRVWIYFATFVPLTWVVLTVWWVLDQHGIQQARTDAEVSESEMNALEKKIMEAVERRTGARLTAWAPSSSPTHEFEDAPQGWRERVGFISKPWRVREKSHTGA